MILFKTEKSKSREMYIATPLYSDVFGRQKGKAHVWMEMALPCKGIDVHAVSCPGKGSNQWWGNRDLESRPYR